ncbi:hypothetical protein IAQ61_002905 [Plenodomus lingam]|uniref:uncharacterized protein n=1 Tax=Leptosphaeria maculans TaxID=5022 RepID=UPI003317E36B|nr:hypothetical protein IAQ61_002905 [Plenodomus lingam]
MGAGGLEVMGDSSREGRFSVSHARKARMRSGSRPPSSPLPAVHRQQLSERRAKMAVGADADAADADAADAAAAAAADAGREQRQRQQQHRSPS